MKEKINIICVANGANKLNGFTDGRAYRASLFMDSKKLYEVINDNGDIRYVLLNDKSPHLLHERRVNSYPYIVQEPVGFFRKEF